MGRFKHLVDSDAGMKGFRAKYHIPQGVALQYCVPDQIVTNREEMEVVILVIAFIEGGMTIPMGRVTQDYLINHMLTPHQCTPNLFRILGCVDALNEQMGLGLTWLDVVHMYECHFPVRDIISSRGLTLLDRYRASLSLTKTWRMTT